VEASAIPAWPNFPQVWDPPSTAALRATYPAPDVIQFYLGNYLKDFSEDRIPEILAKFDAHRAAGAGGVKFFKDFGLAIDDATGARLRVDDRRLYPLWRRAAELKWTVSIHVADPDSWMSSKFWDSPYTKQDLVGQLVHVVEDNPGTVFVAIHLMNLVDSEAELDQLGTYLDRYPNLYADVAARSQYLVQRDPAHVRKFMIAHQDKILFASDRTTEGLDSYLEEFRYWETGETSRTFYRASSGTGLALPSDVLEKLYYRNALRAFCGALR
jgi:predicted TIM-barrel fold metal-dependent hydrolase